MRILLALDGSPSSIQARDLVAGLPWKAGTAIRLLTAYEEPVDWSDAPRGGVVRAPAAGDAIRDRLAAELDRLAESMTDSAWRIERQVTEGPPAAVIIDAARAFGADLIVVGSREEGWGAAVEETVAQFGRLDILVNNAGIGTLEDVESETVAGWQRVNDVNQKGVWLGIRAAAPELRKAGGGAIVNVSSIFGAVGGFGGSVAYHASKGAVRLMSKSAAIRYAKERIRVNSVHPGFIDTPMVEMAKGTEMEKAILADTPMGRWGPPEEIGSVIAFLAGPGASFMTGSEVYVDGGWTTP